MACAAVPQDTSDQKRILCMRFSKIESLICLGTKAGYRILDYGTNVQKPFILKTGFSSHEVTLIELIPDTNLLLLATGKFPNNIFFYDWSLEKAPRETILYSSPVVSLRASRKRIVIGTLYNIFIYDTSSFMESLETIILTTPNIDGVMDLSRDETNSYVGYPRSFNEPGKLQIYDAYAMKDKLTIKTHDNPLVAVVFSPSGKSVATASEKGLLIRVHIVFNGECIYEFRRSLIRTITINSLSFGKDSTYLAVTSSSETIHIFKLEQLSVQPSASTSNWVVNMIQSAVDEYLPSNMNRIFNQDRAFAFAKLPVADMETLCTIHENKKGLYLLVATTDGYMYKYVINAKDGGECKLHETFELVESIKTLDEEWVVV